MLAVFYIILSNYIILFSHPLVAFSRKPKCVHKMCAEDNSH